MIRRVIAVAAVLGSIISPANAAGVFVPLIFPVSVVVQGAKTADYDKIHTVAVISALGSHLTMRNNHFIGPKEHTIDVEDWKIDDEIENRLKQYLSPRFSFKEVPYDRASIAKIPDGQWDNWFSKFPDFLKTLPQDQVDAYIVVRQGLGYNAPGIQGLGLENGAPFGEATPVVWTNYEIDIVDAKTAKVIAEAYSRVRLRDSDQPSFSGIFASNALKVGDDFSLTDSQSKLLHSTVSTMLTLSIIETVRALNMGIELPPPGARVLREFTPEDDPYPHAKSVAIISGVGDVIDFEHLGFTILARSSASLPDPGWNLDTQIEQRARDNLQKRFTIKDVPIDREQFAKARLWDEDGKAAPHFPGLAVTDDVDLYVVFVKMSAGMAPTVVQATGLGVLDTTGSLVNIAPDTEVFANYATAVIDAHTGKVIFARRAISSPTHKDDWPAKPLDRTIWPKNPAAMTSEQATAIKNALTDIIYDSEDETLLRLGLTGLAITGEPPPVIDAAKKFSIMFENRS
jgi:hypothetical protein